MSRSTNTALLVSLLTCILVVVGAMMTAVLIAVQRPVVVVMQSGSAAEVPPGTATAPLLPPTGGTPAPVTAAASQVIAGAGAAQPPTEVRAARVAAVPPLDEIFAAAWDAAPSVAVPVQPQQTAAPMLAQATIFEINVQCLRDDQRIAWRLSWREPTPQYTSDVGEFPDGVAMQFQMVDGAPFTMGAKDLPVRVLHWKSVWQKDVDDGFQDLAMLYPNSWNDLYWFVDSAGPVPIAQIVNSPDARQYEVALSANNPMVDYFRKTPLEELVAEGFGTATHVPNSPSNARGVWKDGRWTVVIDRPLERTDPLVHRLLQSETGSAISLAVWDGSAGNRAGLKHWCAWIPLRIER